MLGTGGPTPGQWVFPICAGPGVIDPMPPIWVTNAQAAAAQVNPAALAQQAVSQLPLGSPSIEMAPPATQRAAGQREHVAVDQSRRVAAAVGHCRGWPGVGDRHGHPGRGGVEHG